MSGNRIPVLQGGEYVNCGHVGYTETDNDYERTTDAERYLQHLLNIDNVDLYKKPDYIALDNGRDFLLEEKEYDVVIIHHLFQYPGKGQNGVFGTSSLHTPEKWRERLIKANPRFIFAYGGSTEVSGGYIETLSGYEMLCYDVDKAVYKKKGH